VVCSWPLLVRGGRGAVCSLLFLACGAVGMGRERRNALLDIRDDALATLAFCPARGLRIGYCKQRIQRMHEPAS
jgi:hypothetical protein